MKTQKITMTITIEVLSKDSVRPLLGEVADNLQAETNQGMLQKDDGDKVSWKIDHCSIEI